jgi:hypothetical protein
LRIASRLGLVVACLVLAGCAATTEPASGVGSTTATLNAAGRSDSTPAHYYFQYAVAPQALGTGFGFQTPTRGPVAPNTPGGGGFAPFSAPVSGLFTGTTYFYRVCGGDGSTHGDVCANTRSLTTTVPGATVAFAPPVDYAVHSAPAAVAIANLQGFGDTDLVSANPSTNDVSVLLNQSDGAFAPAVNYPTGSAPTAIAMGDFTGQGDDDVVTSDASGVSVLLGRGNGTLGPAVHYAVPQPVAVATGDFTGDGHQDIAAYGDSGGQAVVAVLPGNGKGGFGAPLATNAGPLGNANNQVTITALKAMAAGHFDKTGRPDLAVTGSYTDFVTQPCCYTIPGAFVAVLLNSGNGTFTVDQLPPGFQQTFEGNGGGAVAAGPLTSTSAFDDLYYSELQSTPGGPGVKDGWVYRQPSAGDGSFGAAQTIANSSQPSDAIALAHVSSHVDDDLVISDPTDGLSVLPGNGDGTFKSPVSITSITAGQGVASADLNGDGRSDIAVGAPGGAASVAVLMNASPAG